MVTQFSPPSSTQILNGMLSTYTALMTSNGYPTATPSPGSEIYVRYLGVAQQMAVMYNIMQQQVDARMADTAVGSDLDRILNNYGLVRKPATNSQGFVQLISTASQTLTAGMILSATNSLQFQVAQSGVFQPNANILCNSVDTGSNTNLGIGVILSWATPQALMQSTSPVSIEFTGGADAESDSQARARLLQVIQNPPQAGNAQQLINLATNCDPIVQSGFVYSNYSGAGTQMMVLMGYQADGYYIGRDIPHLLTDNISLNHGSTPYNAFSQNFGNNLASDTSILYGQLPIGVANQYATVITTVNNQPCDTSLLVSLPFPIGAPVNGFGNGWLNYPGATWPNPNYALGQISCPVIAAITAITYNEPPVTFITIGNVTSTVNRALNPNFVAPTPGLTKINWINRSGAAGNGWQITTATVLTAFDNGNDTWTITLDTPLVTGGVIDYYGNLGVAAGDYIFPASTNSQNYLDNIMEQFALLGPGQAVSATGLLALGALRFPNTSVAYQNNVGTQFPQSLTSNNPEVFTASILRSSGAFPPAIATPVNIWIPRNLGFYNPTP